MELVDLPHPEREEGPASGIYNYLKPLSGRFLRLLPGVNLDLCERGLQL